MRKVIQTDKAPKAVGPYSQGIELDNLVFTSGQLPMDPDSGNFVEDDIKKQTAQSIENALTVLNQAGCTKGDVVKSTVYLADINDFSDFNEIYMKYFDEKPPARSCFEVANLPLDAMVEIEMIATK